MKITDIKITDKDRERLKRLQSVPVYQRKNFINEHCCDSCRTELATKLVKYQVGDSEQKATRIERYCQKHFDLIIK